MRLPLVFGFLLAFVLCAACSSADDLGKENARAASEPSPPTVSSQPTGGALDAATGSDSSSSASPDSGRDSGVDAAPAKPTNPSAPACAGVVCPSGQACVEEAHGQKLGVCVDTCDCTNCGNCAYDNSDGRWNDSQEYCGNLKSSPATKTCNKPCGGGQGCIYYGAVNICWPLEGCFSAP